MNIYDEHQEMLNRNEVEVIGIEIKMRTDYGPQIELGMWIPPRRLIIPKDPYQLSLYFPSTVHTSAGDLNYLDGGRVR